MHRRERIDWLSLFLAVYLLIIIAFIFVTHLSTIQASHPAYEITLFVIAVLAVIALWRSLFRGKHDARTL